MDDKMQKPSDQALKDQAALAAFVDILIDERNDPKIANGRQQEFQKVLGELNETINTQMVNALSENDQLELDDLLNKNATDDDLNKFFVAKIPNLEALVAATMINFRAAYLYPGTEQSSPEAMPKHPAKHHMKDEDMLMPPPPPPAPVK